MPPLSRAARLASLCVALALVASALACSDSGTPAPAASDNSAPATSVPASASWYHLYFTGPTPDTLTGGIPDKVAASLDAAQQTLDVAVYEFDLPVIADALIRAKERGVQVRLVTDTDSMDEAVIKDIQKAKIKVVDDQRSAIMHDKFVVIDQATVWTGSMNFTENDAYRNNNSFMEIASTKLAENYTREFEEMFVDHAFGPTSPADTPNPVVTLNGTRIENYFAPEDKVAAHILDLLQSAQKSIYFMAFSFTNTDMSKVLIEKAKAGVTVQGVFETRQIAAGGDAAWKALTQAGLDVRQDGNKYNLHSKVFIVDGQTVVMGSYNFTKNADKSNDENALIIHNADIAQAYTAEWQKVWMTAGGN